MTFCFVVAMYMLIARFSVKSSFERTIAWNALNVLAIQLLQNSSIVRNRSVSEVLISVAILSLSLNLASIYSGKYASLRTIPMHKPAIDSKEDLAKSGMHWLQVHEAWSYDFRLSENVSYDRNTHTQCVLHILIFSANGGKSSFHFSSIPGSKTSPNGQRRKLSVCLGTTSQRSPDAGRLDQRG